MTSTFEAEYLFGSVARNEAEKDSDIDIFIIVKYFDYQLREELSKLSSKLLIKARRLYFTHHQRYKNLGTE
jgi:predicted nucleotidyltransferase